MFRISTLYGRRSWSYSNLSSRICSQRWHPQSIWNMLVEFYKTRVQAERSSPQGLAVVRKKKKKETHRLASVRFYLVVSFGLTFLTCWQAKNVAQTGIKCPLVSKHTVCLAFDLRLSGSLWLWQIEGGNVCLTSSLRSLVSVCTTCWQEALLPLRCIKKRYNFQNKTTCDINWFMLSNIVRIYIK